MIKQILLLAGGIICCTVVNAQLRVAPVFGDHMVLQRDKPLHIYGKGIPGEPVTAVFKNKKATAIVNTDSTWLVTLPVFKADKIPAVLTVMNKRDTLVLQDILVGDVWLCAGQSNMEFPLADDLYAAEALQKAELAGLRLLQENKATSTYAVPYTVKDTIRLHPENYYSGSWKRSDKIAAGPFSAVGYYFGKKLLTTTGIPIGLINVAVGGSPCEAWIRPAAGTANVAVSRVFEGDWLQNNALEPWCIQRGHENLDSLLKQGIKPPVNELGYGHPFQPGFLYEAGIQPLLDLQIKGIIWYQGESNALSEARVAQHNILFPLMIADWRKQWKDTTLPFYFCQLSSIGTEKGYKSEHWPEFRDSQRRMADSIPYSGMAVSSDAGHPTNVHPKNKRIVGERLALVALHNSYGSNVAFRGPAPVKAVYKDGMVEVYYDTALKVNGGGVLKGFSMTDGNNLPASVSGKMVRIKVGEKPACLYYGWKPYTDANLQSSAGLPASTMKIAVE